MCVAIIPANNATYAIKVYDGTMSAPSALQLSARYLMQTTFGPTRSTVNTFASALATVGHFDQEDGGSTYKSWLAEQMALPPTLHREYWRKRTNPRPVPGSTTLGATGSPCAEGSRWHPWAFAKSDVGLDLEASESAGQVKLSIGGVARTVGTHEAVLAAAGAAPLRVVSVVEQWGGLVVLFKNGRPGCGGRSPPSSCFVELANPRISLPTPDPSITQSVSADDALLENITSNCLWEIGYEYRGPNMAQAQLATSTECAQLCHGEGAPLFTFRVRQGLCWCKSARGQRRALRGHISGATGCVAEGRHTDAVVLIELVAPCQLTAAAQDGAFLSSNGVLYRHDPRIAILDNTFDLTSNLTTPWATEGFHEDALEHTCPAVAKTFLNEHSCTRTIACSPISYVSMPIPLTETTMRQFYDVGARYVYRIQNLRLEEPYAHSPCGTGRSRWKRHAGACTRETVSDEVSKGFIANAIRRSADANPHVIDLPELVCNENHTTPVGGVGVQLTVDGTCFEHVHPHHDSVLDFTSWTEAHPGGRYHIVKWAEADGYAIRFPAQHGMDRFQAAFSSLPVLGRYADVVDFIGLPRSVQSHAMAVELGAVDIDNDKVFEACGSPGEVANEPAYGHKYTAWMAVGANGAEELQRPHRATNGKRMVHTTIALRAEDQLRQRIAWALSQARKSRQRTRGRARTATAHSRTRAHSHRGCTRTATVCARALLVQELLFSRRPSSISSTRVLVTRSCRLRAPHSLAPAARRSLSSPRAALAIT